MPEGHKTHFIARQHGELLAGQAIQVTSPQGRFRAGAIRVSSRHLDRISAVGKHLFYGFDGDQIIHIHLGRYGKFRQHDNPPPKPVGKVRVRMRGEHVTIDLNGPTTCRVINSEQCDAVTARLGPDPLAGGRKSTVLQNIRECNKPLGSLLLDQSVVAGVGNIFRAEILFEIGVDPERLGSELTSGELDRLWRSLSGMMKKGLRYGRIISVTAKEAGRPLAGLQGNDRFRIYGKQDCPCCEGPVETMELASRKLYFCRRCQV